MVNHALALSASLDIFDIFVHGRTLFRCGDLVHEFALRSEHHEGDAKHGVGACGEDGEGFVAVGYLELYLSSLAASYPVLLCLLDGVAPLDGLQSVEQTLAVGADAETPLAHLFLFYREAAAHADAVDYLIVGKHCAEASAPVDHSLSHEGYAVVHESVALLLLVHGFPLFCCKGESLCLSHVESVGALLLEVGYEFLYGLSLLARVAEEGVEHLLEGPLCPLVVVGGAGAHLAVPVEAEAYLVELFAVAVNVGEGGLLWVLSCLDGILFCWQSVGIVAHGVEDIVALKTLVARIYVAGDVAERMAHMQTGSAWIGEHVEDVELWFA